MTDTDPFITKSAWEKIGVHHHHGICLPLTSLHSHTSGGIGEYPDLIPVIQWLKTTPFDTIQLLPLNDTGSDPSPYMAISANALHPIYLSLEQLPQALKIPEINEIQKQLHKLCVHRHVDYQTTLTLKLRALWIYLNTYLESIRQDPSFQAFTEHHATWLTPYSIFRAMKEVYHNKAWWHWDIKDLHNISLTDQTLAREIFKWRAVQYFCFEQMRSVRTAARENKVLLEGDVPILINKDSADVWSHQHLFSLKTSVGAPPDMYNKEGQAWGFPLYLWKAHKKDNYAWWKRRLCVQEELYDLFRLDHLVGFYRLFAIKEGQISKTGHFIPENSSEWIPLGEDILKHLVASTTMLPLAEDLGDVPDLVRDSMHNLGIPGLKVMRWERNWKTDLKFRDPNHYSPESVTTVSTHDSSTLAGFFEEHPLDAKSMAHDYGIPYEKTLTPDIATQLLRIAHTSGSLFHINLLVEYTNLFEDLSYNNPQKDRINVPGTVAPTNWTYRCKPSIETLTSHTGLTSLLTDLSKP